MIELDSFQLEAIQELKNGNHILVSAPTGSGKTLIAELGLEYIYNLNENDKIIYTSPIKSLCNEKYNDFIKKYNDKFNVGLMTGDININSDGNLLVMTTEILLNTLLKENINISCVIFDEVHYINDDDRGHVWEKSIIHLLLYSKARLILLSATIGNIQELLKWLLNLNSSFKLIYKEQRPVPLKEYVIDNTRSRKLKKMNPEEEHEIIDKTNYELLDFNQIHYEKIKKCWDLCKKYKYSVQYELNELCHQIFHHSKLGCPAIIFTFSKNNCLYYAKMIQYSFVNMDEMNEINHLYEKYLHEYKEIDQYQIIKEFIMKGIAIHHSGLLPKIKEIIELLLKKKLIKIVFATETFAVGLNFPVKTVVMTGIQKPSKQGFRNLNVSEYKQMAGRAGRRFIDKVGNIIFWFYHQKQDYPEYMTIYNLIKGNPTNITSKFQIDPLFILKNIKNYQDYIRYSFKFYNFENIIISNNLQSYLNYYHEKIQFEQLGLKYNNKNIQKLYKQLNHEELKSFQLLINNEKYELEKFITFIEEFLIKNEFINIEKEYLNKSKICLQFHEINSIIFMNHFEEIFKNPEMIIPILSMFMDEGKYVDYIENNEIISYFEDLSNIKYKKYFESCSKWKFFPYNYFIINRWIHDESININELQNEYNEYDLGLIIKVFIKTFQIANELINQLDIINKSDLKELLNQQKNNIIRKPFKIESLYCNL